MPQILLGERLGCLDHFEPMKHLSQWMADGMQISLWYSGVLWNAVGVGLSWVKMTYPVSCSNMVFVFFVIY